LDALGFVEEAPFAMVLDMDGLSVVTKLP